MVGHPSRRASRPFGSERGIALVAALSVLMLMAAASIAFILVTATENRTVTSQRVELEALWNAESGIEIARQTVASYARTKLDSLASAWSGAGPIIGDPNGFFPSGGFCYTAADSAYSVRTSLVFLDQAIGDSSQAFNFRYVADGTGRLGEFGEKRIVADGVLRVSASRGSFTDFLIFTHFHTTEMGSPIWFHSTGTFDGRVHTNDEFRFAYFPTFYDQASSVSQIAIYYNEGNAVELDDERNGDIDVPNFYGGFERGAPEIEMPSNAFSQQRAALGGDPSDLSAVSNSEARGCLGLPVNGDPVPNGVYVPNNGASVTGGIYVAGDAREMRTEIDAQGRQVYRIQDVTSAWTTITIDRGAGTTIVDRGGGGTTVYAGTPRGVAYTDGEIRRLGGPVRSGDTPVAGIADDNQVTIVARDDIRIDRDIQYEDYENSDQALGLFSSGGSISIRTSAPNDLVIDAYVMASGGSGVVTVEDYDLGDYRGEVHLRGGVVQRYYGAFGTFNSGTGALTGYGRVFSYDRRGIVPPFYPTTMRFAVDEPVPAVVAWREE